MQIDPQRLIEDFIADLKTYRGILAESSRISHDEWPPPHKVKNLPAGSSAVYVFSLSSDTSASAGSGRVLKVGKVGPNSNNRFRYQHYKVGSAKSTLAGAIENNPLLWGYINFPGNMVEIGVWIKENTVRNNFYFKDECLIGLFEVYVKANLGPAFEGSLSSKK